MVFGNLGQDCATGVVLTIPIIPHMEGVLSLKFDVMFDAAFARKTFAFRVAFATYLSIADCLLNGALCHKFAVTD